MPIKKSQEELNLKDNYIKIYHWEEGVFEYSVVDSYIAIKEFNAKDVSPYHLNENAFLSSDYLIDIFLSAEENSYSPPWDRVKIYLDNYPVKSNLIDDSDKFEVVVKDLDENISLYITDYLFVDKNKIQIEKISDEQAYITWDAEIDDINYYDHRAQRCKIAIKSLLSIEKN